MELICLNTMDPPYFAIGTRQHLNSTCASTQLQIFFHTGTIFDVVIAMAKYNISQSDEKRKNLFSNQHYNSVRKGALYISPISKIIFALCYHMTYYTKSEY